LIHRDAQNRIKAVAEELGFRATLESKIGSGGADLLLERDDLRIAVEISVTTGVTHELANLLKCLTGNYTHIAFICADLRKAEQILERLRERVSATDVARVGCYQVETFANYLRAIPPIIREETPSLAAQASPTQVIKGWKVKTKVAELSGDEATKREDEALRAIGESLRKPPSQ
jgi:hypothetical protein